MTSSALAPLLGIRGKLKFHNRQYAAEWLARTAHPLPQLDGSVSAAQAYVDRITRSVWWQKNCPPSWLGDQRDGGVIFDDSLPPRRILVKGIRGRGGYAINELVKYRGKWMPSIQFGTTQRQGEPGGPAIGDPWIVLHELAHVMAFATDHEGHGREFARCYMLLVRRWLGPRAAAVLREAYAAERVKYRAR